MNVHLHFSRHRNYPYFFESIPRQKYSTAMSSPKKDPCWHILLASVDKIYVFRLYFSVEGSFRLSGRGRQCSAFFFRSNGRLKCHKLLQGQTEISFCRFPERIRCLPKFCPPVDPTETVTPSSKGNCSLLNLFGFGSWNVLKYRYFYRNENSYEMFCWTYEDLCLTEWVTSGDNFINTRFLVIR